MDAMELKAILTLDTSKYESGLKSAKSTASSMGQTIGKGLGTVAKIGGAALAAASAATVAFVKGAVDTGMKFDSSMSQVAATMGYSVEELNTQGSEAQQTFERLRDFAQEMGASTAFSASEAADALNYMALAGYTADQSMEMLPNVLNLAAAGGMDLARASDMITDSQTALGLTFKETNTLVDQMAKTASKSNTSVEQLGDAILTIGPTARQMAGGTTMLNTALGILADNGIKGSEAGTHLRNIVLSLTNPTDKAADALNQLGVEVYDSSGKMRSMEDIFGDMQTAMSGMDDEAKGLMTNAIFNKTDLASVNALLGTQADRWDELGAAIEDSAGAAQDMADVQLDNLQGDVTIAKSAFEGLQIAVSDKVTPALRKFVQFGSQGFSDLTKAIKEEGLSGAISVFTDLVSQGTQYLISALPTLISIGGQLLMSVLSGIVAAFPSLLASLGELAASVVDYISEVLNAKFPALGQIFDQIVTIVQGVVDIVLGIWETFGADLMAFATAAWTGIVNSIQNFMGVIQGVIQVITSAIKGDWSGVWAGIKQIASSFLNQIVNTVRTALSLAKAVVSTALTAIKTVFGNVWTSISTSVSTKLSGIRTAISNGLSAAKSTVSTVLNSIKEKFSSIFNSAKSIVTGAISAIRGAFNFSWSLPHLSLPHISISGSFSLMPPSVPHFSISWYKKAQKNAYLLDGSTIFGVRGNNFLAGGEAGTEMILGTEYLKGIVSDAMGGGDEVSKKVYNLLLQYLPALSNMQMVTDTGALVGELAAPMDRALGKMAQRAARS